MARPNLSYLKNTVLFMVGLPCGALTGLTGMGASVVTEPLLRYLLGLKAGRLRATVLLVTFAAALGGLLLYVQHGRVFWVDALLVLAGQTAGALLGGRLAVRAPRLLSLRWLWGLLVMGLGAYLCWLSSHGTLPLFAVKAGVGTQIGLAGLTLACAVLAGVLSVWTGLGGALIVPVLLLAGGLDIGAAQGTAIAALLLASLPGALLHGGRGEAEPQAGAWTGFGAVVGGLVGAYLVFGPLLGGAQLVFVYGVALTLLGLSLLWRRE